MTESRAVGAWGRALLVALIGVFLYEWLDDLFEATTLLRPDEGRYAEIAREMAASGDWVTPRLNGLKYFEKPPLQYWMSAAAFRLFGVEPWAARLWPLACAVAGLAVVGFTAARLRSTREALAITAVLGSSLLYVIFGIVITLDMALTLWLTIVACAVALALDAPAGTRASRWMLLAWAAMAAAVLTKGLIGVVLPALAAGAYLLTTRQWALLRRVSPLAGPLLLVALSAPWFVLVQQRNPEFFDFFFIHEHFQRYTTTTHHRTGAWWYFLGIAVLGLLPWTPVLVARALSWIAGAARRRAGVGSGTGGAGVALQADEGVLRANVHGARTDGFDVDRWFACWAIVTVGFFSLSSSKLPGYIVPAMPALAWVVGRHLFRAAPHGLAAAIAVDLAIALGVIVALPWIGRALDARYAPDLVSAFDASLRSTMAWLAAGAAIAIAATLLRRRQSAIFVLALAALFAWDHVMDAARLFSPELSSQGVVAQALEHEREALRSAPFYTVGVFDQTLPFYLRREVTMVGVTDELEMGLRSEPQRGIASVDAWTARWAELDSGYAYMRTATYRSLADAGLPGRVVATDGQAVIVSRR